MTCEACYGTKGNCPCTGGLFYREALVAVKRKLSTVSLSWEARQIRSRLGWAKDIYDGVLWKDSIHFEPEVAELTSRHQGPFIVPAPPVKREGIPSGLDA